MRLDAWFGAAFLGEPGKRPRLPLAALTAFALVAAVQPAAAQPKPDPDWPCAQRRVPTISAGAVWSGPPLDQAGDWGQDFQAAELAQTLASRRTPESEMDGLIDAFLEKVAADPSAGTKDQRLTRVFAGVFELLNTERARILDGITRYSRAQNRLAEKIRGESDKLSELKDSPAAPETDETRTLETALKWDDRIFQERRHSLTYVCETPVLLEKRAFDIGRKIQAKL